MDIIRILRDALKLLRDEPRVFAPRIITTALYSLFAVYSTMLTAELLTTPTQQQIHTIVWKAVLLLASLPALYFIDAITYAMYPRIVKDYLEGHPINFTEALKSALAAWRVVVALCLTIFLSLIAILSLSGALQYMAATTGNILFTLLAVLSALALIFAFSVVVFFVVPAAVLEGKGVRESFAESVRLGLKNKTDILKLNLVFTALAIVTLLFMFSAEFSGSAAWLSIAAFILLRLMQAVVYTYLCVTNPMAYINITAQRL
ncbi:MAG: hypothetical protein V1744_03905 [Candidatus Altiarchaeota archaeon]